MENPDTGNIGHTRHRNTTQKTKKMSNTPPKKTNRGDITLLYNLLDLKIHWLYSFYTHKKIPYKTKIIRQL
jgi:hypothetical protein